MLLNKISLTEEIIDKCQELENYVKKTEEYEEILDKMKTCSSVVAEFKKIMMDLNKLEKDIIKSVDVKDLIDALNKLERMFNENVEHCKDYISTINQKTQFQNEQLKREWKDYFNKNFISILNTLNMIKLVSMNEEMMQLVQQINILEKTWPIEQKDIEKFHKYKNKATKLIENLEVNAEIQNFLRLIVTGNATLKDLTPEILKWLVDNQFDKSIKLSVVSKH